MFTGLIEATGTVLTLESGGMARIVVFAREVAGDASIGDSISVNGVCLTIGEMDGDTLTFYAMPETLRRTALGELIEDDVVNLERAMTPERRFGGHIVQGHVDGVGIVLGVRPEGDAEIWEFGAPETVLRYAVEKGSICIDGISLTVVEVREGSLTVSILPQTKATTNLSRISAGDRVNLEADVIGKYVERLLGPWIENIRETERSFGDAV